MSQWLVARVPFVETMALTEMLRLGWEPFGAEAGLVYLRCEGEPHTLAIPGFDSIGVVPWVQRG